MRSSTSPASFTACLIAVHFGPLPSWINLTLETFSRNTAFNLLLVTDQPIHRAYSRGNIQVIKSSLAEFSTLASQQLGFLVQVKRGYKICDFRPAFGHIFESELKGYDYWGHIDLDTFWGDMATVLASALMTQPDIICGEPNHVGGPFCLYRNCLGINLLYQKNNHHKEAFQREDNVDFDEIGINFDNRGFETTVRQAELQGEISVYRDRQFYLQDSDSSWWISQVQKAYPSDRPLGKKFEFGAGEWQSGKLTAIEDDQDYLFYHFYDGKKRLFRPFPMQWCNQIEAFKISGAGFQLSYRSPFYKILHSLEKSIISVIRWAIYDMGALRHKLKAIVKRKPGSN
ncbi:MAG: hypothetical protein LH631_05775 [Alkalinema sp. CAN_BIN05]|nr:hypothetical protein [Alkalinema sp. CAN_BIN05]